MKNLETLERMPFASQRAVFEKLGSIAEIDAMPEGERIAYNQALKEYRDMLAVISYEREEGKIQGREEGQSEERGKTYANMKAKGLSHEEIMDLTGWTTL